MKSFRFVTYLLAILISLYASPAVSLSDFRTEIADEVHYDTLVQADTFESDDSSLLATSLAADETLAPESEQLPEYLNYILMQLSNSNAVHNGEKVKLTNGFGTPVNPYYQDDFAMVPLRVIAETFDYTVTWDELSQTATVLSADINVSFSVGNLYAEADGRMLKLNAPVTFKNGTVYVPARALSNILGCYIHYYDKNSGEYLLISDYPVSSGDQSGDNTSNGDYSSYSPDLNLTSYKDLGSTFLGPSLSMYASCTLFLRCDCTHSIINGTDSIISGSNSNAVAPIVASDGNMFVPLMYCAEAFDADVKTTADGALSIVRNGATSVFPAAEGYFIQNGILISDANYITREFDGTIYTTVQAFADAMNINYTLLESKTVVFSTYDFTQYDNLAYYTEIQAAKLLLQPTISGYIALTFDDGPSGDITVRLLDGLADRSVHVTFFLCNYRITAYPELMSRYLTEGHEIGNHSASHPNMTHLSGREIETELDTTSDTITQYTGVTPHLFRPPGGSYNDRVLLALEERSMSCIMWNVDPKDWQDHDSGLIVSRVMSSVKDGSVVLLHDLYNTSVDAGLEIIDILQSEGYKIVTVSDLAFIKGYDLQPGQVYYNFS